MWNMDGKKELVEWTKEKKNRVVSERLRHSLVVVSFILWTVGGLFAAFGGWMLSQDDNIGKVSPFVNTPPAILAAVGCLTFVTSSLGVLGAYRENIFLLKWYKRSLLAVLFLGVCSGLAGFAFWPEVQRMIDYNMRRGIRGYREKKNLRDMVDLIQRNLGCCGSLTVDDWDSNPYFICQKRGSHRSCGVPWSCCLPKHERNRQCGYHIRKSKHKRKGRPLSEDIYTIGCLDKAFEYIKDHASFVGGVAFASTIPLFLGICLSHIMVSRIRKQITVFNEANEVYHWMKGPLKSPYPFN